MQENITYLDKTVQPRAMQYGVVQIAAKDGIGYSGPVLLGFAEGTLCFLGLTEDQRHLQRHFPQAEIEKAPAAALGAVKTWLKTGDNPPRIRLYGTPFQQNVWRALLKIPKGKTVTYQQIAEKINCPDAVRAVGSAVGKNPVSVIVPCHRVVHKGGNAIRYGWGAEVKRRLLDFEAAPPKT